VDKVSRWSGAAQTPKIFFSPVLLRCKPGMLFPKYLLIHRQLVYFLAYEYQSN
ncbi:MAG: hypothetical protein ACI9UN_005415, partial [Granulosicoccus sp.]